MLRIIKERLHQQYRTLITPNRQPALSPRYLGRPQLAPVSCGTCRACFDMGPVASQEAIKMLGTNGGGFFNANSAHPFENPTPLTNFLQALATF